MTRSHRHTIDLRTARRASARRAVSLLELVAVVMIVGLLGSMAVMRFAGAAVGDTGAQGFARRLTLDCLQARRRAISDGDNHLLRFSFSGPNATQYAIYHDTGSGDVRVDDIHLVPDDVTVTTGGATDVEFTFTGEAVSAYTISIVGPNRSWSVTIPQATGKAFVEEL